MTDREIRERFHRAVDTTLSGLEGDPMLSQRIILQARPKEEPKMKKKLSIGFVIVLALLLMSVTALAAGLGLNLFAYFGRKDAEWADMADKTVLETEQPMTVAHETLGEVKAAITNAYYDGERLLVAYMVEDGQRVEMWQPDEAALAGLQPEAEPDEAHTDAIGPGLKKLKTDIAAAMEAGQPIGYVKRSILPEADMTANGLTVEPSMSEEEALEDGTFYQLLEYGNPLPEGVRGQESLELRMPLTQQVSYHWFDGQSWYGREETRQDAGEMTATVKRDEARTQP